MRRTAPALAAFAFLSGCMAFGPVELPDQPIDLSYGGREMKWDAGARLSFAIKLFEAEGMTAVCGAWAESPDTDPATRAFNPRAIMTMRLDVDDKELFTDLSFMSRARYVPSAPPEGVAKCRATELPWVDTYAGSWSLQITGTEFPLSE